MSNLPRSPFSWPEGDAFVRGAMAAIVERRKLCVRCGVPFETAVVPCPDRDPRSGMTCAVLHYGERCPTCGGDVYEREDGE